MKILIAEDDQHIREGLDHLLRTEGYATCTAADGAEALTLFASEAPDFVLLDIMMPKMDGYQVCREIRRQVETIPIIFISAKSEEIDKVIGLELGADDFIMKPFGTREVIARIRAITRRTLALKKDTDQCRTQFDMGDIVVFPKELRARRGETVLDLSLRDIQILKVLKERQGSAVDRDTLFDLCWGRDYLPSSRTLDQHISKLRKVIESDPANPQIIQTVHGVGYRFDS